MGKGHPSEGFINLFDSKAIRDAIKKVPQELWHKDEGALEQLAHATQIDKLLKLSLWDKVMDALKVGGRIHPVRIYGGFSSAPNFYGLLRRPEKVAFLFSTYPKLKERAQILVPYCVERFREILSHSVIDRWGRLSEKRVDQVLASIRLLHDIVL